MATTSRNTLAILARLSRTSHRSTAACAQLQLNRSLKTVRKAASQPQFDKDDDDYREAHAKFSQDGNPTLPHDKTFKGDWEKDPAFRADEEYVYKRPKTVQQRKVSSSITGGKPSAFMHFNMTKNYKRDEKVNVKGLGYDGDPNPHPIKDAVKDTLKKAKQGVEKIARNLNPSAATEAVKEGAEAAQDTFKSTARDVEDSLRGAADTTKKQASKLGDTTGRMAESVADAMPGMDSQDIKHKAEQAQEQIEHQVKNAKHQAEEAAETLRHRAAKAGQQAEDTIDSTFGVDLEHVKEDAEHKVHDAKLSAKEMAEKARHETKEKGQEAKDAVDRTFDVDTDHMKKQINRAEDRLEDKAGELKDSAKDLGRDAKAKATTLEHKAEDAVDKAADKAAQTANKATNKMRKTGQELKEDAKLVRDHVKN